MRNDRFSLTALGLNHSRLTTLFMILVLAAGTLTYLGFPKREDPEITVRTAIALAANPGLSIEQIEELIARPMEETARAVPGIDEVRTRITPGQAVLQIDLESGVRPGEIKKVFDELRDDIEPLQRSMPQGTLGPVVSTDFGDVAIASIAIAGDDFTLAELEQIASELRDELYALDAIAAVDLHGVQDERIYLHADRDRLAAIGTTLNPVLSALQNQNIREPAGSFVAGGRRIRMEASGDFASLEEIRDTLIEVPQAGLIRLGDVLTVERGYADPPQNPVYFNSKPAIIVTAEMASGMDITSVGPKLKSVVGRFAARQPAGIETGFSTFQPEKVAASVNGALVNMAQTLAVVLGVMMVFLGWRQAIVIASIVPFAVSFAFVGMGPLGVQLQQVSIAAIIISLGLLVDNGLVIVEDMDRRIRAGETRRDAAINAGRQYTVPLLIASVTTVAAFLPLFLLDGREGEYGYSLGAVVGLMLLGSFLSAVYLLPLLADWFLPHPKAEQKKGFFDFLADGYAAIVSSAIRFAPLTLLLCLAVVGAGISQMPNVRQQMFPLSERNQFLIYMDMPKGTDVEATSETALALSRWLGDTGQNPEVTNNTVFVGYGGPRFVLTLDPADEDPASAFIVVNTTDYQGSINALERARMHVEETFPGARFRLKRLAMGGREPGIDVEISGPDANVLLGAARDIEKAFSKVPGLIQNQNDWGTKHLAGRIVIAQDQVRQHGLSSKSVSDALAGYFDGRQVSVYRQGDELVPIVLRGSPEFRNGFDAIANAAIENRGDVLTLDQLATLEPRLEYAAIRRVDQRRTIKVQVISDDVSALELADYIKPTIDKLNLPPAYSVTLGGEIEQSDEVRQKLGAGMPVAITVMLIALMSQFNSFRRVGITLLCVPLVVAGVPLALLAFAQPLSFFGTLGLIALSGIVINNAIVLIDQIDIERRELPLDEAVTEAARKRFRPILLTSLTTVLGLVPMAMGGGALWEPMATLMIGGLGLASLLTLFYVPALYRLFFRSRSAHIDTKPVSLSQSA